MISSKVHRSLYQGSIKRFIESKKIDTFLACEELNINLKSEMAYSHLFDALEDKFTGQEINDFLFHELNYGKMKNIYINLVHEVSHLQRGSF